MMNIGIIGGGSIGLLIGSYLSKKHSITIYVRRLEQKKVINTYGVYRDGMQCKKNIQAMLAHEMEQEDVYILCVKQPHIKQVLSKLHTVVNDKPVIFLQNGMGHLEHVKDVTYPTFVGTVEHGAMKIDDYRITHTGKGLIKVASYSGDDDMLSYLIGAMDGKTFPIQMFGEWESLLKEKLIINAVINPLTALFDVKNGYILKVPHIERLAYLLCKEAALVLGLDHKEAWKKVRNVVCNTSENVSSMVNDIKRHQETEIDAITGYILRYCKEEAPHTTFIYHSIKAIEDIYRRYGEHIICAETN